MTFDVKTLPILSTFRAVGTVDNTTAQPTVIITWDENQAGPYKQVDNDSANDVLMTELPVIWSADVLGGSEQFYLTSGAVVANKTRQVQYTVNTRGPLNQDSNNPITTGYSRNYKSHKNNAFITIDETWLVKAQNNTFTAATTTNSAEAGENLTIRESVSLHTDGKLYKYHFTNYPNVVGIVNATVSSGSTATYTTFGGVSTGHSGLTLGGDVFAENTGAITQTSSASTTVIGTAETATTIRVAKANVNPTTFSDATFEIYDNSDSTKRLDFQASGVTTATTRTATIPDNDFTLGGPTVDTVIPFPITGQNSFGNQTISDNTTAYFTMIVIYQRITINKFSIYVASSSTSSTFDCALYSEDGQTQHFEETTADLTTSGTKTTNLSSAVTIEPGNYYWAVVPNNASVSMQVQRYGSYASNFDGEISGEAVLQGTKTVTAGTLPATFDPTSDITVGNHASVVRFD